MPTFAKGCKPPKDLANRARLSTERHGDRFSGLLDTPSSYDCRTLNLVPPVKDQGQCGDCYIFSGVGCAEMAAIVAGFSAASSTNWSEQSVLDCGSNGGCNGGWPEQALEQAKNSGLANTSDYPYQGGVGLCRNVPHPNTITDYGYVGSSDAVPTVQQIKAAMMMHGPISCAVAVDDSFEQYKSGVFPGTGYAEINHAILLVGWQDDASVPSGGYWILRNSWNTSWGESGYMRIAYSANQVGYGAMWATAGNTPTPVPPGPTPVPPGPSPAPLPPTPAPTVLTGTTAPTTVTVTVPLGHGQVQIPIPALAVTVNAPGEPDVVIPWAALLALLVQYGAKVLPVVFADVVAGKSLQQILADVIAAVSLVDARSTAAKKIYNPCGC